MLHQRKRKRFSRVTGKSSTISLNITNYLQTFALFFIVLAALFNIRTRRSFLKVWYCLANSRITNVWRGYTELLIFFPWVQVTWYLSVTLRSTLLFLVQGQQQSFWKFSMLSNILDLKWCLPSKRKIHSQLSTILAEIANWASLVARPRKCYINRMERFI